MSDDDEVPEPYIGLWKVAVLIVAFSFLTPLGTLALGRAPTDAVDALGNPPLYLWYAFPMTIALAGVVSQNRANRP